MNEYVIKLDSESWIAPWAGDPGRTLVLDNAKKFPNKRTAMDAFQVLKKAFPDRNWENAEIELFQEPAEIRLARKIGE